LAHRVHALGAGVDAVEAMGAVVDPVRVLGQVTQALAVLGIPGFADEPIGLGQRGRADEQRIDLHGQAVRDTRPALDAGHGLGDVDHVLVRNDVLALGDRLLVDQPGRDPADLLPVHGVHVDDQIADHGHVAHRLDRNDWSLLALVGWVPAHAVTAPRRLLEVGVAGQARLAVHADPARAADRLLAGAADADRAVLVVL